MKFLLVSLLAMTAVADATIFNDRTAFNAAAGALAGFEGFEGQYGAPTVQFGDFKLADVSTNPWVTDSGDSTAITDGGTRAARIIEAGEGKIGRIFDFADNYNAFGVDITSRGDEQWNIKAYDEAGAMAYESVVNVQGNSPQFWGVTLDSGHLSKIEFSWPNVPTGESEFMYFDSAAYGIVEPSTPDVVPPSGGGGDPHFKTFAQEWFDFHGGCDLVLAEFPSFAHGLGLTAHVRTTMRYDYSYIESAAIQIGEDILEVSSWGNYVINGVTDAKLPSMISGYLVEHDQPQEHQHIFKLILGGEKRIEIKTHKDLLYINLDLKNGGDLEQFQDATGLMGSWDGTRLARDGATTLRDANEFGQEWQVHDTDPKLFGVDRSPQFPAKCQMPAAQSSRRLGESNISEEAATMACSHIKDDTARDMCIFDVIATNDLSVAQAGAY